MMDLQKIVDAMGEATRLTRAQYQLTLGELIEKLESLPVGEEVKCNDGTYPGEADSYRGYYSDLAFKPTGAPITVGDFLEVCRCAMGKTFEGYKGGAFTMTEGTPVWLSSYRSASGIAIMDVLHGGGAVTLATKQVE